MSIRSQIALLLLALSITFVTLTYAVQAWVVLPAFAELEREGGERSIEQCVDAIGRDIESLSHLVSDWSSWDDMYRYLEDQNKDFASCNLQKDTFGTSSINLLAIIDTSGSVVFGECRDIETLEPIEVPDFWTSLSSDALPLASATDESDRKAGIILTSNGPMLVASYPILNSKAEGPIRGTMVMGRFLTSAEVQGYADRLKLMVDIWSVHDGSLPPNAKHALTTPAGDGETRIEAIDSQTLCCYTTIDDLFDNPALLVRVTVRRDVTAQGHVSAMTATLCSVWGGVLTIALMWGALQWRIVGPISNMCVHAVRIGTTDDLKARLDLDRDDELGTLAKELDAMVASLAESRKNVLEAAHSAGMAEIASEVLHNVGNAVNSANCSIEQLEERFKKTKLVGLDRATKLLCEQAPRAAQFFGQDARGPKLIEYFASLNESLRDERLANEADLDRLRETIRHIRDAITSQQTFARSSDFRQEVELAGLVAEALLLNKDLIHLAEVTVELQIPPLPELHLNKGRLNQVLVNLIRNAVQSMQSQASDDRRLTISAGLVESTALRLDITDTGGGISAEVLAKLFTHGFTTKPDGNGFGLHYCANVIREAGGSITAESAGVGLGATFHVYLPNVLG